jgi:hypothetical protein
MHTPQTLKNLKNEDLKKELNFEASKKKDKTDKSQSNRVRFAEEELKFNLGNMTYENLNLDYLNFEKVKFQN